MNGKSIESDILEIFNIDDLKLYKENSEFSPDQERSNSELNDNFVPDSTIIKVKEDMSMPSIDQNLSLQLFSPLSILSENSILDDRESNLSLDQEKTSLDYKIKSNNNNKSEIEVTVPVDKFAKACQKGWSVFGSKDFGIYSIVLSKTDLLGIKKDVLQVLENDGRNQYIFFQRCGGSGSEDKPIYYSGAKDAMINIMSSKLKERLKQGYEGQYGYEETTVNYLQPSKLHRSKKKIMEIISNNNNMSLKLIELEFDLNKISLERLTKKHIIDGYKCLNSIGLAMKTGDRHNFMENIEKYYEIIPRKFKGQESKLIEKVTDIEKEVLLLDTLSQIEEILKFLKIDKKRKFPSLNLMDDLYNHMRWKLEILLPQSTIRQTIEDLVKDTDGFENSMYKCFIRNVFEVKRKTEGFKLFTKNMFNTQLLWYGLKITNWYVINSQGLHILPDDTYATTVPFNKGIYMADMSSRLSITSCFTGYGRVGFFGLIEATIGEPKTKNTDPFLENLSSFEEYENISPATLPLSSNICYESEEFPLFDGKYTICKSEKVSIRYIVELEFFKK